MYPELDPDPLVRGLYRRIWMSQIPNTGFYLINFLCESLIVKYLTVLKKYLFLNPDEIPDLHITVDVKIFMNKSTQ
jgi:hypothetical protein